MRPLPLMVYPPAAQACSQRCKPVLFGTGYRASMHEYSFLGHALANAGYLMIVLQHDLPSDAPMPNTGNIATDRGPFWQRGSRSLAALRAQLPGLFPAHDWASLALAGHSQGGDIAALFATTYPAQVGMLFTFDNRRVPLPDGATYPVLSLRSADQPPDPDVLPPRGPRLCIRLMPQSPHDQMNDAGTEAAKAALASAVLRFLDQGDCPD